MVNYLACLQWQQKLTNYSVQNTLHGGGITHTESFGYQTAFLPARARLV